MALRENIIFDAVQHFNPDVVLVDKAPAGVKGEMLRALRYLRVERPQTKLVLGMRDIEDGAAKVRTDWRRNDIYPLLEDVYDIILLYGSRAMYDPVREYGLSPTVEAKLIPCGYIRRSEPMRPSHQVRRAVAAMASISWTSICTCWRGWEAVAQHRSTRSSLPDPSWHLPSGHVCAASKRQVGR
jgi:predicted glycosyltransferase